MPISPVGYACSFVTEPPTVTWVATNIPTDDDTLFVRNMLSTHAPPPLTKWDTLTTLNNIMRCMHVRKVRTEHFHKLDDAHVQWLKDGHETVKGAFYATRGRVLMTQFPEGSAAKCIMKAITWSGATIVGVDVHIPTTYGPLEVPYLLLTVKNEVYPCDIPVFRDGLAMLARCPSQGMLQLYCEHGDRWAMGNMTGWGRIPTDWDTCPYKMPTWGGRSDWDDINLDAPPIWWHPAEANMMNPDPNWNGANYTIAAPVMLTVAMQKSAFPGTDALPFITFGYVHHQFDANLQRRMNARLKLAGKLRELLVLGRTKIWLQRLREVVYERQELKHILHLEHVHPFDEKGEPLTLQKKMDKITKPSEIAKGLGLVCPTEAFKNAAMTNQLNHLKNELIRSRIAGSEQAIRAMQSEERVVKYTIHYRTNMPSSVPLGNRAQYAWAAATGPDAPLGPRRIETADLLELQRSHPELEIKKGTVFRFRFDRRRLLPFGHQRVDSDTVDFEVSKSYGAATLGALSSERKRRRIINKCADTSILVCAQKKVGNAIYSQPSAGGAADGWKGG